MQESGGKELVDFGGILVSAGGMRRYAGITCIFVGGQIYPGEEIQDGGGGLASAGWTLVYKSGVI